MKRRWIHAAFGTVAICCAAWAAYGGMRLRHAGQVEQAIAAVTQAPGVAQAANAGADGGRGGRGGDEPPQVQLARAMALSKAGAYDAAGRLYNGLIHEGRLDGIGLAALFDLGNMYLREGSGGDGEARAVRSLAMIGEAKARYRMALRAAPDDWDARYNLERALWLAPETQSAPTLPDVKEQHNIKLRDPQSQDLP
ncbi:tetratricopeptide repeat protein [Paraburkholderia sp. Ac-20336]|uniref:tetratricopeptide repeat protein n=1 Tax=Paraburkholderia sp. Ac-20336 TaxID=2703886 RepID=UPI00198124E1|nr:tetratricopeptide repeat protein [Paraburkholderia sp. Ac-20336]MBN3802780.1 tetratricopeptide repeat protein [Paraburkholderia sp. Ac-20336]